MTQNSPHANSIPEEWLSAYLDDELSVEQRQLVEAAVKDQPQLAQLLDELIATRRLIQQLPAFPTSVKRLSPSNTNSSVSDLDDGLDGDESASLTSLAYASDRQLQQRLADSSSTVAVAPSERIGNSSRLSWRMLTLAASLIGVAALGTTLWYQSDRWLNLAFDAPREGRSTQVPDNLVDSDSGPKAFGSVENRAAPATELARPGALDMQSAKTESGMSEGAMSENGMGGAGLGSDKFGVGPGSGGLAAGGGLGAGGMGSGSMGAGGLGGGLGNGEGAAPPGNFSAESFPSGGPGAVGGMDNQLNKKDAFNLLHGDPNVRSSPAKAADSKNNSDLLGGIAGTGQVIPDESLSMQTPSNALQKLNSNSPSISGLSSEQSFAPQLPSKNSTSPGVEPPKPAASDLAMNQQASPNQTDESATAPNIVQPVPMKAVPGMARDLADALPAGAAPNAPDTNANSTLEKSLDLGHSVEALPAPALNAPPLNAPAANSPSENTPAAADPLSSRKANEGIEGVDRSRGLLGGEAAPKAEAQRGMDNANSSIPFGQSDSKSQEQLGAKGDQSKELKQNPGQAKSDPRRLEAPSISAVPFKLAEPPSETLTPERGLNEAAKKPLPQKSPASNSAIIPKSAWHKSTAWSESDVMAQLEGNPLYRPMLSLLDDANQDKSRKEPKDAKANVDASVLTAVVRLTADQRTAVVERSKQIGIEPAIKDDGQTAWLLFLSANEFDRLLEAANQQEKLSIFWISPAKQAASSDRRVLIVNPY